MEWLKIILPLIGVFIGWMLSEGGKIFADKRQDKRKLKKLLYFLLELRFHFSRELSIAIEVDKALDVVKGKLADKMGMSKDDPEFEAGLVILKPFVEGIISKAKSSDSKFEYLSENIDKILIELAEIFPFLAYELVGQHNIKERLNKVYNYFEEFKNVSDGIPFDISEWISPKLTQELLSDLDISIEKIAKKINENTWNQAKEKIAKINLQEDSKGMEKLVDDLFGKFEEHIEKIS